MTKPKPKPTAPIAEILANIEEDLGPGPAATVQVVIDPRPEGVPVGATAPLAETLRQARAVATSRTKSRATAVEQNLALEATAAGPPVLPTPAGLQAVADAGYPLTASLLRAAVEALGIDTPIYHGRLIGNQLELTLYGGLTRTYQLPAPAGKERGGKP